MDSTSVDLTMVQLSLLFPELGESDSCSWGERALGTESGGEWDRDSPSESLSRIYHLEQALDQALACIDEMRQRVQDQALLEAQLAATEEFASVQQQAIARLKLRLNQQQEQLRTQTRAAEERDRLQQEQLAAAELLIQAQQQELEVLQTRFIDAGDHSVSLLAGQLQHLHSTLEITQQSNLHWQSEAAAAQALADRLGQHLETAQQRGQELAIALQTQENRVAELEAQMQPDRSTAGSAAQRSRTRPLRQPNRAIASLGQDLARAQIRVEELEIELARQSRLQNLWRQGHRELAEEGDRHRSRILELEHQMAELQKHILRQSRQFSEAEVAVQHWKERYFALQQKVNQIWQYASEQGWNAEAEDDTIPRLLIELRNLFDGTAPEPLFAAGNPHRSPVGGLDIPDFLLRRRTHRQRPL